jgi:hypothetical protein
MNFLNPLGALIPKIPFAFFFILGPGRLRSWQQHIEGGQHRQPQMTAARSRPANVHHPLARTTLKFENLTETIPRAARRYKQWPSPHECTGHQVIPQSPPPKDKKGEQWAAGQLTLSQNTIPGSKSQKTLGLHGQPENGTTRFHGSNVAQTTTAVALTGRCSRKEGATTLYGKNHLRYNSYSDHIRSILGTEVEQGFECLTAASSGLSHPSIKRKQLRFNRAQRTPSDPFYRLVFVQETPETTYRKKGWPITRGSTCLCPGALYIIHTNERRRHVAVWPPLVSF